MVHGDSLTLTIDATQRSLEQRLREARRPHRDPHRPRDNYAATDTFMAATSPITMVAADMPSSRENSAGGAP